MSFLQAILRAYAARQQRGGEGRPDKSDVAAGPPGRGLHPGLAQDHRVRAVTGSQAYDDEETLERFLSLPVEQQLRRIEEELAPLEPAEKRLFTKIWAEYMNRPWNPTAGPQTDAYLSQADVLLYGGQAGGGKTDLLIGLSLTAHIRSLICRREYGQLKDIRDRVFQAVGTRDGYNGRDDVYRFGDRTVEFGAAQYPGDETKFFGRPHDLLAIDEAALWQESQVRTLMGWVRTTIVGQRCRVVLATNPPTTDEGQWLVPMFAPWLDPSFPDPAVPGALRWVVSDEAGLDRWVDGPEPVEVDGVPFKPTSRSYIPAALQDNPYLVRTEYVRQLQGLPEPLRSAMLRGDWHASKSDDAFQVIPSDWIATAQARWTPQPPVGVPMTSLGVDVAQGGSDQTVLAPRYVNYFSALSVHKGIDTKDGPAVAGLIFARMRDGASIAIDLGGGWGGSAYDHLKAQDIDVVGVNPAEGSQAHTREGRLAFRNRRAELWWNFREALDPVTGNHIALPPDPGLVADLATPRWKLTPGGILIEQKEDIRKRLGRSTDKADAVILAWATGAARQKARQMQRLPQVNLGYSGAKRRRA